MYPSAKIHALKLRLGNGNPGLLRCVAALLGGTRILNQARSLEVSSLLPSKARGFENSADFLESEAASLNKEVPHSHKLVL